MKETLLQIAVTLIIVISLVACEPSGSTHVTPPPPPAYNWSLQVSNTPFILNDVYFINQTDGWIVGDSLTILTTTTGGSVWTQTPQGNVPSNLRSTFFVDSQTGWMTGSSDETLPDGQVFVSKTGGAYPIAQDVVNHPVNTVFFLDASTGWAAGDSSILLHTENAGDSWSRTSIGGTNAQIFDLHFLTAEVGWASANHGGLYHTKDGATWEKEDLGITSDLRAIHFVDTLHGWACGSGNTILRRGLNASNKVVWTASSIISEPVSMVWRDIFFVGAQVGWVVGAGGAVYKTIDGGTTWTQETIASQKDLHAIYMFSSTKGWIVGEGGAVLTYTP